MKASDYIARTLAEKGVTHVFEMIGGMITHLIDSIHQDGRIKIISVHHEQAGGFAAEAVGRITGVPGIAMATSGPGATNLITAIGSCFFDSVPTIFLTGQVNTNELKGDRRVRQLGFQETDIVSVVKPITKAAWLITDSSDIPIRLEQAFALACSGRPGPVLLDIPMNVQRESVNAADSETPRFTCGIAKETRAHIDLFIEKLDRLIRSSHSPLIIAGGGISASGCTKKFRQFVQTWKIPVAHSLMGVDLLPFDHPCRVGMLGSYGNRWANIAVDEADLLLVMGSRLDIRQTGALVDAFREGKTILHIDCDEAEINNRVSGCHGLVCHLNDFFDRVSEKPSTESRDRDDWRCRIRQLRNAFPDTAELEGICGINPNRLVKDVCLASPTAGVFVADVGKHQMWAAQSSVLRQGQRFLTSGGMGSMGFALPVAMGAALATEKPVVCFVGDGGLQCNIQELETIRHLNLPVKIVVFNNHSLGMVRQFQNEYFNERYAATEWGYSAPDFTRVSQAYDIPAIQISSDEDIGGAMDFFWEAQDGPALLSADIHINTPTYPKIAFGQPIRGMFPERPIPPKNA